MNHVIGQQPATDSTPATREAPDVTVVIVNYNTAFLLDRMFAALNASRGALSIQIVVVDNASRDNSVELLRARYPDVELIANPANVGFARANNQALARFRGRYLLLLNTDAFVAPDTLTKTVAYMDADPRCGILGVKLVGEDGSLQPSCRYFPTPWNTFLNATGLARFFPGARLVDDFAWDHASVRECDWVPGCYYLIRRAVIETVGLFDPRYFLYCEEVDHCRMVRNAGWKVIFYPHTQVIHIGGESAKSDGALTHRQIPDLHVESELLYFRKHHGLAGAWGAVLLAILGDTIVASKGLLKGFNTARAATAMTHTSKVLRRFFATRLASRATR